MYTYIYIYIFLIYSLIVSLFMRTASSETFVVSFTSVLALTVDMSFGSARTYT